MTYDLVVRGASIVDGTGLPRRSGDLGVADGRIVAMGSIDSSASTRRSIDADGLVAMPGIVDIHTHYDAQATFDPWMTSSCFHGVTTIVAGNCGFSVAPARQPDREFLTALLARVEGMSPLALAEGLKWRFETFEEYLGSLRGAIGINVASYIGHSSVRRWVMGEAASSREATDAEVGSMRDCVSTAVAAGALGLSSSLGPTQLDAQDRPVPSRVSDARELLALADAAGRAGAGSIAHLPYSCIGGLPPEVVAQDRELLIQLGEAARVPVIIQGLGGRNKVDAPSEDWEEAQRFLDEASARGVSILALLRVFPYDRPFVLALGTGIYVGVPQWHDVVRADRPLAERIELLRDPEIRARMRDAVDHPNMDPSKGSTATPPSWESVIIDDTKRPELRRHAGQTVAELAQQLQKAPADAMLDLALEDDLQTSFRWRDERPEWERLVRSAQCHPSMIVGISDGGAHLDRDDGSYWSSYFLKNWVLDRQVWSLEEGVRQITAVPAAAAGLSDRGTLRIGGPGDIALIDTDHIDPGTKELVYDLPGGAARFITRPKGVEYTIVNGEIVVDHGELTGTRPGHVVTGKEAAR